MVKMRLFVAIELPNDLRNKVTRVQKKLRGYVWDVKWVEPENLHISVVFIGSAIMSTPRPDQRGGEQVEKVKKVIEDVCGRVVAFRFRVGNLRLIGGRVVALEVAGELSEFKRLQEGIADGLELKTKLHPPHLTLGRVRRNSKLRPAQLRRWRIERAGIPRFKARELEIEVEELVLMESQLTPTGPVYTVLEGFKLVG